MGKRFALGLFVTAVVSIPTTGISGVASTLDAATIHTVARPAMARVVQAARPHAIATPAIVVNGTSDGDTLSGPAPTTGYCATWKRRWYDNRNKRWVYTDHNTPAANGSDQNMGTPENIVIKKGDQGHNDARYGVNANDFWVEALGGGGYGSNGYPYPWLGPRNANGEPTHNETGEGETGEGGVVQGDVHPQGQSVNFSVWAFSLDDEGDTTVFHDTVQGACVQAGGQTVSTGDVWLPTHNVIPHP